MKTAVFEHSSTIPRPVAEVYQWHTRPGAFERLTPPWENARLASQNGDFANGSRFAIELKFGPMTKTWIAQLQNLEHNKQFVDVQLSGPFAFWEHRHLFAPAAEGGTEYTDRVEYAPPYGVFGQIVSPWIVKGKLERMFRYRHKTLARDLATHAEQAGLPALKVAITGAGGMIGTAMRAFLTTGGHKVLPVTRKPDAYKQQVTWNPAEGVIERDKLESLDAVIHLAGDNIASGRWSEAKKKRIRDSRVNSTRLLAETLAGLNHPPKVVVCASAVGYYGTRGDEVLYESSQPGEGFLPDVCREWEEAAAPLRAKGVRVVHARLGVVTTPVGGALGKMLLPFNLGLGGRLGSGDQYWSWISIEDVLRAFLFLIRNESIQGPVNLAAPEPLTNRAFTREVCAALNRPGVLPAPEPVLRLVLGEMADEMLLSSARAVPKALMDNGFRFTHTDLKTCVRELLGME